MEANRRFWCRLFGFLLGSTLTGAGVYYYVLEEYKVSNHYLSEDIYVRFCIYPPPVVYFPSGDLLGVLHGVSYVRA